MFNATAIPVAASQTAAFSVPSWDTLNSTQYAPTLQVFQPGYSQAVTSYTLTNGQQGLAQPARIPSFLLPVVVIAVVVIVGVLLAYSWRKKS